MQKSHYKQLLHERGICVVIPTYNNVNTILDVVKRTLIQCDDVIVGNDGCTDGTAELLREISSITLVDYEKNEGKEYNEFTLSHYTGKEKYDFIDNAKTFKYNLLNDNGILAFEIGHDQGLDVRILMEEAGFSNVKLVKDLAGLDRVLLGYLKCW